MAISFSCLKCGKKLKAPDNAAGKSSKCPGCGATVTCPEPIYDAELVESPDALAGGLDPFGDLDSDKPYAVAGPTPAEAASSETGGPASLPDVWRDDPDRGGQVPLLRRDLRPGAQEGQVQEEETRRADAEDLTTGDWIVAILCSAIGCIAGIVWMIQGKPKGAEDDRHLDRDGDHLVRSFATRS